MEGAAPSKRHLEEDQEKEEEAEKQPFYLCMPTPVKGRVTPLQASF